jgi:hypothetical protein
MSKAITLTKVAALCLSLALLGGCTGTQSQPQIAYQYDDIPPAVQGRWTGESVNKNTQKLTQFTLILQRGVITHINYTSEGCYGRLKYQRTENGNVYTFLEQIDSNPAKTCPKNSYVQLTSKDDSAMFYSRNDMNGKLFEEGLVYHQQP